MSSYCGNIFHVGGGGIGETLRDLRQDGICGEPDQSLKQEDQEAVGAQHSEGQGSGKWTYQEDLRVHKLPEGGQGDQGILSPLTVMLWIRALRSASRRQGSVHLRPQPFLVSQSSSFPITRGTLITITFMGLPSSALLRQ